ncbi:DUF3108 domain-containing protein [Alteromonas sp. C1M14]|uniref:DUF3108 domain-containing protein n=1 Tax=Alteromonas sp. C1M14 TaxID=2841567 RepID=UPI001C0A48EA|nr:DUF3108 domain-containing protein [Alteromonas sp. C1M14]MBU2976782.1 DUF3108 domain-containing protein [Alteromonas sp. C1M14]
MIKFYRPKVMRTSKLQHLVFAVLILLSGQTAAQNVDDSLLLTPFEATYTAFKWDDDVGTVKIRLEPLSVSQYSLTYSSEVSKFFLSDERFEHSIFHVKNGAIVPDTYYYKRTGTGPDKQLELKFVSEPEKRIEVADAADLPWNGETDNQLYRLDLAHRLANGETKLAYNFVNYRGEFKHYGIEIVGKENLALPYGNVDAIKVKLIRDNNTRQTYAWFAPSLSYTLVRLQQFKDDSEQGDIQLSSYVTL